jgi:uncharacterized protein (DUF488 family)
MTIWTVGHSTRSEDELAAALAAHGIERVVDVRRFPASRRHPQFRREGLEAWLPRRGIDYVWMGEPLGGFRKAPAGGKGAWAGYLAYMESPEFAGALDRLERLARARPTAVMCAEALFPRCHRQWIAEALVERGWTVRHILDAKSARPHEARPRAKDPPRTAGPLSPPRPGPSGRRGRPRG